MYTTFHIDNASDLNLNFLNGLKTMFKNKPISITVEDEQDETEYLLASEENKKVLEESLNSKEGYAFSASEFSKLSKDLLQGKKTDISKVRKVKVLK